MNEIISTVGGKTLANKALVTKTKQIFNALNETKKSTLKIAKLLREIAEKDLYSSAEYGSIHSYAADVFGFKENYTSKLLRVAKYVNNDFTTIYDSENQKFTAGQIIECLPLDEEQKDKHIGTDITANMSAKEIREKVRYYRGLSERVEKAPVNLGDKIANQLKKIMSLIEDINLVDEDTLEKEGIIKHSVLVTENESSIDYADGKNGIDLKIRLY